MKRLSPLVRHHIIFVGRYYFVMPDEVQREQLRLIHEPGDQAHIMLTTPEISARMGRIPMDGLYIYLNKSPCH